MTLVKASLIAKYILFLVILILVRSICWKDLKMNDLTNTKLPWDTRVKLQELADENNYLLPEDDELLKMNKSSTLETFWRYINWIQTLCHRVERYGSFRDGGKEVCLDEQFSPRPPCLVLSFGINNDFSFDDDIRNVHGCQVHSFDPSMKMESHQREKNHWFYNIGLGSEHFTNSKNWSIMTLGEIRTMIGHEKTTIDVLKMDIEGDEWESLRQMITSRDIYDVKQMLIEFHLSMGHGKSNKLAVRRDLYNAGFRICMRERNLCAPNKHIKTGRLMTMFVEVTMIKMK